MVSRESATSGLCDSQPSVTIQIDETHSHMVKFTKSDYRIDIIASKLSAITGVRHDKLKASLGSASNNGDESNTLGQAGTPDQADALGEAEIASSVQQSQGKRMPWDDKSTSQLAQSILHSDH